MGVPRRQSRCPATPGDSRQPAGPRVAAGVPQSSTSLPPPHSSRPTRAPGTSSARPLALLPLPRRPSPGAPLPTRHSHLRRSRKHLRSRPRARRAPSCSPAGLPSAHRAQGARFSPSSLRDRGAAHPRPAVTHLHCGAARRCLRLRLALTSDSGCVRRPHRPGNFRLLALPDPAPRRRHAPPSAPAPLPATPPARPGCPRRAEQGTLESGARACLGELKPVLENNGATEFRWG